MSNVLVLTPPPTPNGRLHIGHVSGPYLRADLYVRLRRFLGLEALHLSHIDVYQSYVPKKAAQLGRDPHEFLQEMIAGIEADFASFQLVRDRVVDNRSRAYLRFLNGAVQALLPVAKIEKRDRRTCAGCASVLFESAVRGRCPHCLHECYENVCENCCHPQAFAHMIDPVCGRCHVSSVTLDASERSSALILDEADLQWLRSSLAPLAQGNRKLSALLAGLRPHELGFAYDAPYGVDLPCLEGKLNPWIEIFFAHLYGVLQLLDIDTTQEFETCRRQFQDRADDFSLVYFLGADNLYYYAIVFTMISRLLGLDGMMPIALQASYFLLLNDAKVSSSRNNVMWAAELAGGDIARVRGSLAARCPEFGPRNYSPVEPSAPVPAAPAIPPDPEGVPGDMTASLSARLRQLADPCKFDVETLLDVLEKGTSYRQHLLDSGRAAGAQSLDQFLTGLNDALMLA